jgi:phage terminase small subunit
MAKPKLTAKQEMFCLEYLIDLNATQAAIRAGYSNKTAQAIGAENLTKPLITEFIQKAMAERIKATKIDAAYVLKMSDELLKRCMVEGEDFSPSGAGKALDLIGKHVDVQAFNEKSTTETTLKVDESLANRLTGASKR